MEKREKLAQMIQESDNIVFFGGAGVSTESEIPDFRSPEGLYSIRQEYSHPAEVILSHSFFMRDPKEFYRFHKSKMIYPDAKPNKAHLALAKLEEMGKLKAVITQNIDGLHQMAGNRKVLELHGSVHRNYCMKCSCSYDLDFILSSADVPRCVRCGGIVRPDVVLYEEGLDMGILNEAVDYISHADILIVGGTSLTVYPAAGLIRYYRGDKLVLINRESTSYDKDADLTFSEPIGEILGQIVL